ncbi:hypothetical protein ACFL6L_01320 [candidate division KSB1 bacterium]
MFRKTCPDIIADAPKRIDAKQPLPLVCFVRCGNAGPLAIESISIKISQNGKTVLSTTLLQQPARIERPFWQRIFTVQLPSDLEGFFFVNTFIRIEYEGKSRTIHNSSFSGFKNIPLTIFRATEQFPRLDGFRFGDIHFHSYDTSTLYQTGFPLPGSAEVARAIGIDFYTVSFHSYAQLRANDAKQPAWDLFRKKIEKWNENNDIIVLPGEEIGCRNSRGGTVQMLSLNGSEFVVGTGNAPYRMLQRRSEHTIKEAVDHAGGTAANFALPSEVKRKSFRRFFSYSGKWKQTDIAANSISGIFLRNAPLESLRNNEISFWIQSLLQGKKRYIVTGGHASGNLNVRHFSRFASLKTEKDIFHVFGSIRTGIYTKKTLTKEVVLSCVKKGRSVVTNGPIMNFIIMSENEQRAYLGEEISGHTFTLKYKGLSTPEFGPIRKVEIFIGDIASRTEESVFTFNFHDKKYKMQQEFSIEPRSELGYIRCELLTQNEQDVHFCFTNPIWIRDARFKTEK